MFTFINSILLYPLVVNNVFPFFSLYRSIGICFSRTPLSNKYFFFRYLRPVTVINFSLTIGARLSATTFILPREKFIFPFGELNFH